MDMNSIKDQVSNLTLYDLKAGVRKVQNGTSIYFQLLPKQLKAPVCLISPINCADRSVIAVMNYTEMESKVRTITNPSAHQHFRPKNQ
jgi:hypothetical protein